jgi:DNA polymerase
MRSSRSPLDEQWTGRLVQALRCYHDLGVSFLAFPPDRRPGPYRDSWRAWLRECEEQWRQQHSPDRPAAAPEPPVTTAAAEPTDHGQPMVAEVAAVPAGLADKEIPEHHEAGWRLPPMTAAEKAAALDRLQHRELGECTRCKLCHGRRNIVFGEGNPDADLMFVGEGPGEEEDRTGRPFVGRAGLLLNDMIRAMTLDREKVYIANVVKCRPPGNRDPETDEISSCQPFLYRQIEIIQPKVIVCLGRPAACLLFGRNTSLSALRGSVIRYQGAHLIATYHPSYLLRIKPPQRQKQEKLKAWTDLKQAMNVLGLRIPSDGKK